MKKKYAAQYAWRKRNKEKVNKIARAWRKANPNKMADYWKRQSPKSKAKRNLRNSAYMKKRRADNPEATRKHDRAYYKANPHLFAPGRHATELRNVIAYLTGKKTKRGEKLENLYDLMASSVKNNKRKAAKKFPFGKPDAFKEKVEWKFGFDRIRDCQFVWNILNGEDCQIRWAKSCDEFERAIRGKKNSSKLFKSYRDFVIWGYGIIRTYGRQSNSNKKRIEGTG